MLIVSLIPALSICERYPTPIVPRYTIGANRSKESNSVEIAEEILAEFVRATSFLLKLNVAIVNKIATVIESKNG